MVGPAGIEPAQPNGCIEITVYSAMPLLVVVEEARDSIPSDVGARAAGLPGVVVASACDTMTRICGPVQRGYSLKSNLVSW